MTDSLIGLPREADTDHALMLAVRDGDVAQLGELFERHHGQLFGFFVNVTGDRPGSEDLVQLVFYRIMRYRHSYRDVGSFCSWMYQIARRVLSDYRRQMAGGPRPDDEADLERMVGPEPHAAEVAEAGDETALLHRALDTMAPEEREILVLAKFQELPHADIAEILGVSVGAVKVRVHRALKELRCVFFKLSGEPPLHARPEGPAGGPSQ